MSDSSNSPTSITLTKEISTYNVPGHTQAWRMKVTVADAQGIDPNIFVYQTITEDTAQFSNVASPLDLEAYPTGAPADGIAFYRVAQVDLICANPETLHDTWNLIKADVDELVLTMEHLGALVLQETHISSAD